MQRKHAFGSPVVRPRRSSNLWPKLSHCARGRWAARAAAVDTSFSTRAAKPSQVRQCGSASVAIRRSEVEAVQWCACEVCINGPACRTKQQLRQGRDLRRSIPAI